MAKGLQPGEAMQIVERSMPSPGDDELLVRIVGASLCGSDLVSYNGWHVKDTAGMVGGHEATGIIVDGWSHSSRRDVFHTDSVHAF